MLFLKPPFHLIAGTAVFPDHADPRFFHYLPAAPHLSEVEEPGTGLRLPQIQLLKFRGGAGDGGFLTFQVDLGLAPDARDRITEELARLYPGDGPVRIGPALVEDGSVRLLVLGRAKDGAGQPVADPDGQPRFVLRVEHAAKPALYGDNQAVFSVELDREGVELIENSLLHSELMPIGVVYQLDFLALRPAFSVRVSADWDRVQSHLEESFKVDVLFASSEIDEVVDKLIEAQVVTIEVDSFLPEGEDAGSWVGRRDQAVDQFRDMVLERFFKPSLEPAKEEKDGWTRFTDTAERLALIGATGGWGGVAKFSYVKKDIQRIDRKRIDLQMNERVTVRRSIYPQATLKGLGRTLAGTDPGRFIQSVTLDDPWFERRKLKAHGLVDFAHDDVESVLLTVTYDGTPRTVRLTSGQPDGSAEWNSLLAGGRMVREVPYEYRVTFKGVDTAERPGLLQSGPRVATGDEFEVSPRGERLYFVDDIEFGADTLPWDRFPQVSVEVRYADPVHDIRLAETFLLTKGKPTAVWKRFRLDPASSSYDVRVTFLAQDHRDVVLDWTSTDQEKLLIRDPHPLRLAMLVAPAVNWALVTMVFVELSYSDPENGIDERQMLSFYDTPADRVPKPFTVNIANGERRAVGFAATFVLKDGRTIEVPRSVTMRGPIVLRTDMAGHRVVTVEAPPVDFAAAGLVRVEARLSFRDEEAGLSFEDRFVFAKAGERAVFEFDVTADRASYACVATLVLANGLVLERDLGRLSADRVVLPAG